MLWGKGRYAKPGYTTGAAGDLERGFFYLLVGPVEVANFFRVETVSGCRLPFIS